MVEGSVLGSRGLSEGNTVNLDTCTTKSRSQSLLYLNLKGVARDDYHGRKRRPRGADLGLGPQVAASSPTESPIPLGAGDSPVTAIPPLRYGSFQASFGRCAASHI